MRERVCVCVCERNKMKRDDEEGKKLRMENKRE